ncbi:hypothetical protein EDD86DRAFT_198708 [Gorgonomyces haynaldii]|nr:hypothetical protein EDD86DRAFT_198708 [Gorgonomyces haynaldii]
MIDFQPAAASIHGDGHLQRSIKATTVTTRQDEEIHPSADDTDESSCYTESGEQLAALHSSIAKSRLSRNFKISLHLELKMSGFINEHSASLLRYAALGVGAWYGLTHYNNLVRFVKDRKEQQHQQEYLDLIEEGKIAFEAQYNKEQAVLAKKDGIATIDSDHFRYDGERWMNWAISRSDAKKQ